MIGWPHSEAAAIHRRPHDVRTADALPSHLAGHLRGHTMTTIDTQSILDDINSLARTEPA